MKMDDREFKLYSSDISKLMDLRIKGITNNQEEINELFVNVLRQLESESYSKYKSLKSNTKASRIARTLTNASGYAADIVEDRLEETLEDHLECQRRNPEIFQEETYEHLLFQLKLLGLECFVSGLMAGSFNIQPFEKSIVQVDKASDQCRENSNSKSEKAHKRDLVWRTKANEIKHRWREQGLDKKLYKKSELILAVIKELDLASKDPGIKQKSLQAKVRRALFPTR